MATVQGTGGSLQPKAVRLEHRSERQRGNMLGQGPCAHWPGRHLSAPGPQVCLSWRGL